MKRSFKFNVYCWNNILRADGPHATHGHLCVLRPSTNSPATVMCLNLFWWNANVVTPRLAAPASPSRRHVLHHRLRQQLIEAAVSRPDIRRLELLGNRTARQWLCIRPEIEGSDGAADVELAQH